MNIQQVKEELQSILIENTKLGLAATDNKEMAFRAIHREQKMFDRLIDLEAKIPGNPLVLPTAPAHSYDAMPQL